MRISTAVAAVLLSIVSANSMAFETNVKPHAMFYVTVPLGGPGPDQDKATFGFRLDNIYVDPATSGYVDYHRQLQQPAVFDLRMDRHGLDGIYVSGIDYLQLYKVNRQNEEEGVVVEETQAEEDYEEALPLSDRIRGVFADMRSIAPMGIWIGAGLGIGLLLGVDD